MQGQIFKDRSRKDHLYETRFGVIELMKGILRRGRAWDTSLGVIEAILEGSVSTYTNEEGIINVSAVIASIRERAVFIVLATLAVSIFTFGWMRSLPDQYRAEVHLISTNSDDSLSLGGLGGDLGGIASLAGLNNRLGSDGRLDNLALDIIVTPSFVADFLSNNDDLIPLLIAVESWSFENDAFLFDKDLYDSESGWIESSLTSDQQLRRLWTAVHGFTKRLQIIKSSSTNMVTLGFEHERPRTAVEVLERLEQEINSKMRDRVVNDSQNNIQYLTAEANKTSVADLKAVFYRLIEEQTKTLMLASSNRDFVFKKVTPILQPVSPSGPPRALITVIFALITFLLGCVLAIIVGPRRSKNL